MASTYCIYSPKFSLFEKCNCECFHISALYLPNIKFENPILKLFAEILFHENFGLYGINTGADIIMQLDDVVHVLTKGARVEEAMWRSVRWLDR